MSDLITLKQALNLSRKEINKLWSEHINPPLAQLMGMLGFDIKFVRAQGTKLWDEEGNEYLDALGGYGALNLGHNYPAVLEALLKVKDYPNMLQASLGAVEAALAYNLAKLAPGELEVCFFCCSGTEAVEAALKLARAATGRSGFIYAENAYHGKTFGALSVGGNEKFKKSFEPLLPGCEAIPFNDIKALEAQLKTRKFAAFIVEPVQGEAGFILPALDYFKKAQELCRQSGTLLILDEIQTGLGRTGKMFAAQHYDCQPDIMTLAKTLSGGYVPAAACLARRQIWDKAYGSQAKCLLHTSTFGGATWASAAGIAALEVLVTEKLPEQAAEKGKYFLEQLQPLAAKHKMIKEVRGLGLMLGVEFYTPSLLGSLSKEYLASMVAAELLKKHRILTAYTLNNPNVLRLEPALIITKAEIDRIVQALDEVCSRHKSFLGIAMHTGKQALSGKLKGDGS
jgi:putrescine aminotransferase